ncbi:MAG: aminotransferase class V-fold PLP-dependent enzyme, partial [Acidimicrobiales bacterium]
MREWVEQLGRPDGAGDPGRVHEEGRTAREAIEVAREQVARLAHVSPNRVVFTSGATESANAAVASSTPASAIVCARVEHSCVRGPSVRAGEVA